jgi:NAD+ kinase
MAIFKKIAIIARPNSQYLIQQVQELANLLHNLGFVPIIDDSFTDQKLDTPFQHCNIKEYLPQIDLAIIIGGDGTLLSASRQLVEHDIPLIGINQGKLGFMTDVAANEMLETITEMLTANLFTEEERNLLFAEIVRDDKIIYNSLALNDVVISRGATGSMIEFDMSIDNEFVCTQKSDGLIFATPTGSTAYSLAAGGPILHPLSKVFAIVPICPQSMSNRPIVVSDEAEIQVQILTGAEVVIHSDGQEYLELKIGDIININKSVRPLRLLHPEQYSYYRTLRNKLHWAKRLS